MAFNLIDLILDNSGAIGSRLMGISQTAERDRILEGKPTHDPSKKNKPTADERRKKLEAEFNDVKGKADSAIYVGTRTKLYHSAGSIVFDAVTNFDPKFSTKVTSFPVEDGAEISDHIINENPKFTLSAVISDASAGLNPEKGDMTESDAYKGLLNLRDRQELVSLLTPRDTYSDLVVTEIGFPKAVGDGLSLKLELSFEKIRRVSSELTTVFVKSTGGSKKDTPKQTGDTDKDNKETKDGGAKPPTSVPPDSIAAKKVQETGHVKGFLTGAP